MASGRKVSVKWNIPQKKGSEPASTVSNNDELMSDRYIYSDDFEDKSDHQTYSHTYVNETYSDTFTNESDKNCTTTDIKTMLSLKTSLDSSEIQEASNFEIAKSEMLETVIEVDSDMSYSEGMSETHGDEMDTTRDVSRVFLDTGTHTSDSQMYSDTFESSERTKAESQYETTEVASSGSEHSTKTDSYASRSYTDYSEDESLLDRSYIAPDYNGKSLTDDEDDNESATFVDDYSYTFEPTELSTYKSHDPEQARIEAEQINKAEQERKDFVKSLLTKLKSKPEKKFKQLETVFSPIVEGEEDDYLKHFCKKKVKLMKRRRLANKDAEESDDVSEGSVPPTSTQHPLLSDYGLPDSVLERAKITNILSAMKKAAKEEIHDPRKCEECRDVKSRLDEEDAHRQFVTAHAKRLKNKLMDAKVEEHMLKMNSISMIAELARELPRASEKPEKIFDKLFEPLLGKNVMR